MKKMIYLIIIVLSFPLQSCIETLPLVLPEGNVKPIRVWVDNPPKVVGNKAVEVVLKYDWGGEKSEFEEMQNPDGEIIYTITGGKFAAGRHHFGRAVEYKLEEKGEFSFYFSSNVEGGNATGGGRLMLSMVCKYKDKDGNKHRGGLGGVSIDVTFKTN